MRYALAAAMLAACAAHAATDAADPAVPPPSDANSRPDAARASERAPDAVRYRTAIEAPSSLVPALRQNVDLVRWEAFADMTEALLERLVREAPAQARAVADVEGHFSAEATITIDRATDPVTVTLRLVPGAPTLVRSVRVAVTGAADADVPDGVDAIARSQGGWRLARGAVFRQVAWEAAKTEALDTMRASPYAAATIATSRAEVDPEARAADLDVAIASGPPFRFGAIDVRGLHRYPQSLVRNFATIRAGDRHSQEALDSYARRLDASGYFASVHAAVDPDPEHADDATVHVDVIEAPTRRLEFGIGYSTDTQFRGNFSWRDVDVGGRALQFTVDARIESKVQNATVRFVWPPTDGGWRDSAGAQIEHTDIENLATRTAFVAARRQSVDERRQVAFGAAYYIDKQRPAEGVDVDAHALYVDAGWIRRDVDDVVAPTRGYVLALQAGAGIPGVSTLGFGRAIAQFQAWLPIGRESGVTFRTEVGAVFAKTREGVPSTLLFRTGGDTTVRGYAYQSLGVKQGDTVSPGRYYALASVEAVRWINETWGAAVFVDAGNAGDEVRDVLRLALGYGVGARVRTPIGPFRLDLAYGQDERKVRVHFSVGLAF